jgi:hypothetical protein
MIMTVSVVVMMVVRRESVPMDMTRERIEQSRWLSGRNRNSEPEVISGANKQLLRRETRPEVKDLNAFENCAAIGQQSTRTS